MDRCMGHCDITKILLKTALKNIQPKLLSKILTFNNPERVLENLLEKEKNAGSGYQYFLLFLWCFLTYYRQILPLTLYHKIRTFINNPEKVNFWKHFGKGENAGHQHFLLFPQCFLSTLSKTNFAFLATFKLLSANALKFDQSIVLSFGIELILYLIIMPILSFSNSAANKDMMSNIWTNGDTIIWLSRKCSGKRRNCSLQAISYFLTMFSNAVCCWCVKMSIYGVKC